MLNFFISKVKWKCNSKCNSHLLFSKEKVSVMYAYLFQTIPLNTNQWFWSLWAVQKIQDLCNVCLQIVFKPRKNSEVKELVLMARFYTQFIPICYSIRSQVILPNLLALRKRVSGWKHTFVYGSKINSSNCMCNSEAKVI